MLKHFEHSHVIIIETNNNKIMAYITKEQAAAIKKELKATFPEIKFSVVVRHYSSLDVSIMSAPMTFNRIEFADDEVSKTNFSINHHYTQYFENGDILKKIVEICNRDNYDKSDVMTDYFNVGYYFSLSVGKWDKPFQKI